MIIRFICFILLITSLVKAEQKDVYFEKISPESGFTFNEITSITEDVNGLLWFSCNNRLYHYNTSTLEEYSIYNDSSDYSNPEILDIVDDNNDMLVCTNSGLYRFNKENKSFSKIEIYFPNANLASNSAIRNLIRINEKQSIIVVDRKAYILTKGEKLLSNLTTKENIRSISFLGQNEDKVLIGTHRGEVYTMNKDYTDIKLLYKSKVEYIRTICKDGNKYLIGFHDGGIEVIDLFGNYIESLNTEEEGINNLPHNMIRQIIRRDNGEIWIGTYKGIVIKRKDETQIINYESARGLPNSSIYVLSEGQNGGIWVGTWAGGIAYYRDCNYKFRNKKPQTKDGEIIEDAITAFAEDNEGNIWVASERAGENVFKVPLNSLTTQYPKEIDRKLNNNILKDISFMNPNKLVILDFYDGIVIHDLKNNTSINSNKAFAEKNIRIKNVIEKFAILDDKVWLFYRQLMSYSEKDGVQIYDMPDDNTKGNPSNAWNIYFDSAHNLWICTEHGLYVKYTNSDTLVKCLIGHPLENETIYTCCEDKDGQIWLGTAGEGAYIYHPESDTTSNISQDKSIRELDVYSIVRSHDNDMWFSSNKGIYHWTEDEDLVQYTEVDGLSGKQFKPNSGYVCSNGQILFGTMNCYNIITPSIIRKNMTAPHVMLSDLKVNNEVLSKKNSVEANSMDIYNLSTITLKNSQNTLSLKVFSNNYVSPTKNKFKYRLVNYNDEWVEIDHNKEISFTKIPAGSYTFEAYGSNNDDVWSTSPYQLSIRILPALWLRWYFIVGYTIALVLITFFIYRNITSKLTLEKSIKEEKQRSQLNDSIHEERVKFFVNISHELRTPLTLILSPVKSLIEKYEKDDTTTKLLKTVDRNSKRLLRLTDQTLDFRLLEMGKLKPHLKKTDIIELAVDSYTFFEQRILEREINFSFYSEYKFLQVLIDNDMIEKIIFNLISNAIDFTPADGNVKLSVRRTKISNANYDNVLFTGHKFEGSSIEIKVEDSGIGFDEKTAPDLFKRFTKAGDEDENHSKTGIGLHLCSEYATLNDGNIMVHSSIGNGSTFVLNLPEKDETEFVSEKQKHIISHTVISDNANKSSKSEDFTIRLDAYDEEENVQNKTILIVDNNKELLSYLKKYLDKTFRVVTAHNSTQAMKVLNQLTPDIIVTEIVLPEEDGYSYLERIKNNKKFSSIPVIVLTQLSEKKEQIRCLQLGVDAYLNKPIEDKLLLAQINNLTKKKVSAPPVVQQASKLHHSGNMSSFDGSTFTAVAEQVVLDNLQSINFDANTLANKMEVSYSTLFRRIKKETDISATQFIRDIRLKKSIELLKSSDLSIDEVGTSIGFNSTSYFVRSFKKKYNRTPSEYRKAK